jgi:hypothetical protein
VAFPLVPTRESTSRMMRSPGPCPRFRGWGKTAGAACLNAERTLVSPRARCASRRIRPYSNRFPGRPGHCDRRVGEAPRRKLPCWHLQQTIVSKGKSAASRPRFS